MAQTDEEKGLDGLTHAWAVTAEGEAVYRRGVCNSSPAVSSIVYCFYFVCFLITDNENSMVDLHCCFVLSREPTGITFPVINLS